MNEINKKFEGNLSWDFKLNNLLQYDEDEDWYSFEPKMFLTDNSSETIQVGEHNGKKIDWVVACGLLRSSVEAYNCMKMPEYQKRIFQYEPSTNNNSHLALFLLFKNASGILSGSEKLPVKLKITIDESSIGDGDGDGDSDGIVPSQKHVLETEYEFSKNDPCYFFSLKSSASTIKYLTACKNGNSVPVGLKPIQFKCRIKFRFNDTDFKFDNCFLDHLSNIDDEFSDFEIKVGGTVFRKHKLILARCPYFRRLFATDMIESAQSSMEIEDFSPQTVSKMLEYLYTGQIIFSDDAGRNLELHRIADKYEILDLKEGLQSTIAKNIQIENACQIFKYADGIGSKELKEKAIKFIVNNREEVLNTEGFKELKSSPDLLIELCLEFSKIT